MRENLSSYFYGPRAELGAKSIAVVCSPTLTNSWASQLERLLGWRRIPTSALTLDVVATHQLARDLELRQIVGQNTLDSTRHDVRASKDGTLIRRYCAAGLLACVTSTAKYDLS